MKQFIGCDVHKKYSVFVTMDESGTASRAVRVEHGNGELEGYLSSLPDGTPVAVETTGYWMRWRKPVWSRTWRTHWQPSA